MSADRADRLEQIARLKGTGAAKAAHAEIVQLKKEYEANLGRTLMETGEVDQREIDYKRGYWRGMLWAYTALLDNAGPRLAKLIEAELAERGDNE